MDAFQILSRSTNLRKSALRNKSVAQQLPSAGAPAHPQFLSELTSVSEAPESKTGTKRKRSKDSKAADVQNGLNYFNKREDQRTVAGFFQGESETDSNDAFDSATGSKSAALERKSEDVCKSILKAHKLKIAVMENRSIRSKEASKQSGRARSAKSQNQTSYLPIYPQPLEFFEQLRVRYGLSRRLVRRLKEQGFELPTEVQLGSLPVLLGDDGERGLLKDAPAARDQPPKPKRSAVDLITIAPTGSGKTLAFLLFIFQSLLEAYHKVTKSEARSHYVKAIVIAPTHELVDQIVNEAKKLSIGTGSKVTAMRKGMRLAREHVHNDITEDSDTKPQAKSDIIVSTPLLLLHALSVKDSSHRQALPSVQYLVLDEADILLDPLFREQTLGIWNQCVNPYLQVSLWSATIGSSIESLAQEFINERRRRLSIPDEGHRLIRIIAGLRDSAIPNISHRLTYAATEQGKLLALRQLLHPSPADPADAAAALRPPFIIFTQTIPRAIALHSELLYDIPLEAGGSSRIAVMHSDLSESARANIMAGFRTGDIWVIITTDLLARGVDFRGVNGVVNYDIPNTAAAYVHRAGRTGRAGRQGGVAVTLYTKEDIPYVKNIANVIAASEKARGTPLGSEGSAVQQWLLDALPKVSKKTKQALKKRGVEARRPVSGAGERSKEARKMRISTKSGFDRRTENRRKGAISGAQRRMGEETSVAYESDDEWNGIED